METIKVNMNPNPLDVQTIHASQNDGEARQWGFELHNNGELIDTSEITEQLFFKAYKGGTEQILPENTSTPTTSPFKGDIKYPQGLLADQEFAYRHSPTEEDGLAKITDIRGNTLVWNQLVQNGNFASTNFWRSNGTLTIQNNVATIVFETPSRNSSLNTGAIFNLITGHKYLYSLEINTDNDNRCQLEMHTQGWDKNNINSFNVITGNNNIKIINICENGDSALALSLYFFVNSVPAETKTVKIKNIQIFDLTQMGLNSITDPAEFTSLFPLPYYAYNAKSLLSFNGTGLKTIGRNLNPWEGVNYRADADRTIFLKKGNYVLSTDNGNVLSGNNLIYVCLVSNGNIDTEGGITSQYLYLNGDKTFYYGGENRNNIPFTLNKDSYVSFGFNNHIPTNFNALQLEYGSVASDYEPYTESVLSLPISTYFPSGMKSAGNVYDELTESKAITRIGAVDLGSLTWEYISEIPIFQATITGGRFTRGQDLPCDMYSNSGYMSSANMPNMTYQILDNGTLWIKNTSYTSATAFKQAMTDQNVKLYYELATPTETSFTTASLVTENAEIPLSNEDGKLIGKCTEKLSENPGFFDAKIKLTDADGECYSNKIQLHVERSPQ